jgi:hypothetical protein
VRSIVVAVTITDDVWPAGTITIVVAGEIVVPPVMTVRVVTLVNASAQ